MPRTVLAAFALLCVLSSLADAGGGISSRRHSAAAPPCVETVMRPCHVMSPAELKEAKRVARGRYIADELGFGGVADKPVHRARGRHSSAAPAGIVGPLAAKVAELQTACGSVITPHGGVRHTYVKHTRRLSLHASGKAVDMRSNPNCLYAHLKGWQGGYSVDYRRVRHVHISWDPDGREWGVHFRHGGHRHAHRHRVASAR